MILAIVTVAYSTRLVSSETIGEADRRSYEYETVLIGDPAALFVDAVRSPKVVYSLLTKEDHVSDVQPCSTLPEDSIHL